MGRAAAACWGGVRLARVVELNASSPCGRMTGETPIPLDEKGTCWSGGGWARVNRQNQIDCSQSSCFNVFLRSFEPSTLRVCLGMLDTDTTTGLVVVFRGTFKAVPHAKAQRGSLAYALGVYRLRLKRDPRVLGGRVVGILPPGNMALSSSSL